MRQPSVFFYLVKLWLTLLAVSALLSCLAFSLCAHARVYTSYVEILGIMCIVMFYWVSTCPLFLNISFRFRKKGVMRFLSFFLLPVVLFLFILVSRTTNPKVTNIKREVLPYMLFEILFLVCLMVMYMRFVHYAKKNTLCK